MPVETAVQFAALPPHMKTFYNEAAAEASRISKEPFIPYADDRMAGMPEDIRAAHEAIRRKVNAETMQLDAAESAVSRGKRSFTERTFGGGRAIDQYMNPYQRHVVNQIAEEGNRNFRENVLPALEAKFVKLGQFGGSRHADMARRAARDLQHEILSRQQQALASGYQQAGQFYNAQQARELEAASQLGGLAAARQGLRFADAAALENQGRYQQQQQQAANDVKYQEFLRQLEDPRQKLAFRASILQGLPTQAINQAYYQTPATPQMNIWGALGPMVGQIATFRNMFGGGGR